jgi:hypothetical protein
VIARHETLCCSIQPSQHRQHAVALSCTSDARARQG